MPAVCPFCGGTGKIPTAPSRLFSVDLREGGSGSHQEWAFLIRPDGQAISFRKEGRRGERYAGKQTYYLEVSPGDLIVRGYRSGSGKTYSLTVARVLPTGKTDVIASFHDPVKAEQYLAPIVGKETAERIA